jgi:hypothetical protein
MCVCVYIHVHTYVFVVETLVRGRTLLLSGRRFGVSSSHLVNHELVDGNSLALRAVLRGICVMKKKEKKSFAIPCPFIEGKPKIGARGRMC